MTAYLKSIPIVKPIGHTTSEPGKMTGRMLVPSSEALLIFGDFPHSVQYIALKNSRKQTIYRVLATVENL